MTVTRKPDRRGEHEVSRKTIAQGRPGYSGEPVVTTRVLSTFAHEAAGALGTRLSLRPLSCEAKDRAQLGRIAPRERGVVCVSLKI